MSKLKENAVISIPSRGGKRRLVGKVRGETFLCFERVEERHLFRGGLPNTAEAIAAGSAAWGLDMALCDQLHETGQIRYVEIPTPTARYRTRLEELLGPHAFGYDKGHRPQYMLPLARWVKLPPPPMHE